MNFQKVIPVLFAIVFLLGSSLFEIALAKGRGGGSHSSHSYYRSSSSHRGSGSSHKSSYSSHRSSYSSKPSSGHSRSTYSSATRDSHGHVKRSDSARHQFMKQSGYPKGRPGYVIDHVVPLKRGGADRPSNMQWQTKGAAKAKDKWE